MIRHPGGDKLIVARSEKDEHWIYFSVHDPHDHGTIIDFVQKRDGGSLGEIRGTLRAWLAGTLPEGAVRPKPEAFASRLDSIRKDLITVRRHFEAMRPIDGRHAYLEDVRDIPPHILTDPLFVGRIYVDEYGNAVFPHFNRDGLCGFERRGTDFRGFAAGAVKGLWCSHVDKADSRLVIAESAIDALSHAGLRYQPNTRYVSTAGELNPDQLILLQRAMGKMPEGGEIVLALDHDAGGDQLGGRIEAIFAMVNRPGLALLYDRPATPDTDWNDTLRVRQQAAEPGPALLPPRPRRRP